MSDNLLVEMLRTSRSTRIVSGVIDSRGQSCRTHDTQPISYCKNRNITANIPVIFDKLYSSRMVVTIYKYTIENNLTKKREKQSTVKQNKQTLKENIT